MADGAPRPFTFTLSTAVDGEPTRVTVYPPTKVGPITTPTPHVPKLRDTLEDLLNRLGLDHIECAPDPTATLVNEGSYRIDTQPATAVFRNLHYQVKTRSYAVLTVDHGAQLCLFGGYEIRLLKFIKLGLRWSCRDGAMYNIRVTVEKKKKGKKNTWVTVASDVAKAMKIKAVFQAKIAEKFPEIVFKRMISAKNARQGAHVVAKKIPLVSTFLGAFFAVGRLAEGDWTGATAEFASGVAADLPGAGTAVSLGIDAALLGRDIKNAIEDSKRHKQLAEKDVERLRQENKQIRSELAAAILPDSPVYGAGRSRPFDESELANLEDIKQIRVRCGDMIDAIQVVYLSASGQPHGGQGGSWQSLDLQTGERITAVAGTTICGGDVISSLTFRTDFCQEKTFGSKKGEEFTFEMTDGCYLAAIKGFDAYTGESKRYPKWSGDFNLLPAIGFIQKMHVN